MLSATAVALSHGGPIQCQKVVTTRSYRQGLVVDSRIHQITFEQIITSPRDVVVYVDKGSTYSHSFRAVKVPCQASSQNENFFCGLVWTKASPIDHKWVKCRR